MTFSGLLIGELLIDYHHQANVGRHVHQIRHEAFVKAGHSFVPPCFLDAVPAARVAGVLVLQPGADHLVRVGGRGRDQLGDGREQQVLAGGLRADGNARGEGKCVTRFPSISIIPLSVICEVRATYVMMSRLCEYIMIYSSTF